MQAFLEYVVKGLVQYPDAVTITPVEREGTTIYELRLDPQDVGKIIGRQGQTLSDLQYITNRLLFQQDTNAPKVMVDVGDYRASAREALVKKAQDAAEKVRRWGDVVELEPLNAFDRRIVHQAIKDDPDIEPHSVAVEGTEKKAILLRPKH